MLTNFQEYKLFELGEGNLEPYPFIEMEDEDDYLIYQFQTEKHTYQVEFVAPSWVMFTEIPDWLQGHPFHILSFRTLERAMNLTKENVPFKILATIVTIIKKVIGEQNLETIVMHPLEEEGENDNRREKFYARYIEKNLPSGWFTIENWVDSEELGRIKLIIMTKNKEFQP